MGKVQAVVSAHRNSKNLWQGPEPLVHSLSPMFSVGSCGFLNLFVELQGFELSLADILEAKLQSACGTSSLRQLFVNELFWHSVIVHSDNLTKLAYSSVL